MKHDWIDYPYKTIGENWMRVRRRICINCKKVQIWELQDYDRVGGSYYLWRPLAGRCKK